MAVERAIIRRAGGPAPDRQRVGELRAVHAQAHRAYQGGFIKGDAMLVRSAEYARLRSRDWHLQWDKLISGRLDVAVVPGTHAGLSQDAPPIARTIRAAMDSVAAA